MALPPRPFDPERFAELRRERGVRWGRAFHYSGETGSTNDDALAAARGGAECGSVFLADHQTKGRGRRGKTWLAEPGRSLLFSIVLRPEGASSLVSALTLAVGLGVRAALAASVPTPLGVKWPNDVLAGRRKLAGILCEGQFDGARLQAVVLGIGINVYASAELPAELASDVTSLEDLARERNPARSENAARDLADRANRARGERADAANRSGSDDVQARGGLASLDVAAKDVGTERNPIPAGSEDIAHERNLAHGATLQHERDPTHGAALQRERVLVDVLAAVEARVSACLEGGFTALLAEFSEHDTLAGLRVVVSGASPISGIARGVDTEGRLLIESDGLLIPVVSGTVRAVQG